MGWVGGRKGGGVLGVLLADDVHQMLLFPCVDSLVVIAAIYCTLHMQLLYGYCNSCIDSTVQALLLLL